jgi:hypothetical protein
MMKKSKRFGIALALALVVLAAVAVPALAAATLTATQTASTQVTVQGCGFTASQAVTVKIGLTGGPVRLYPALADATGCFTRVVSEFVKGGYTATATDQAGDTATATVTVT